jgi:ribosomal-protein-alanine N-acetyltransferase
MKPPGGSVIGFFRSGLGTLPAVRLDGPRVFLRPPRLRDWKGWAGLRDESRGFLTPWEPTWPEDALTRAAYLRRLRRGIMEWRHDESYGFLVFESATRALIGGITLSNVRRGVCQAASLGYWIGQRYARRGLMSEAARLALGFGFRDLGLHRIEAACLPSNVPSQRLLTRVGFTQEGFARAYLKIDGAWRDHLLFGIIEADFASAGAAAGAAPPAGAIPLAV